MDHPLGYRFGARNRLSGNPTSTTTLREHILFGNAVKDSPFVSFSYKEYGPWVWAAKTCLANGEPITEWLADRVSRGHRLYRVYTQSVSGVWHEPCISDDEEVKTLAESVWEITLQGSAINANYHVGIPSVAPKGKLKKPRGGVGYDTGIRIDWSDGEAPEVIRTPSAIEGEVIRKARWLAIS